MKRSTTTFARLGVLEVIDAYELQYLQAHSIYECKHLISKRSGCHT